MNRTQTHICAICNNERPIEHFRVRIKLPELRGRTYHRTEWGKLVLDTSRPCRACRANAASRDAKRAYRKREEEARLAKLAHAQKHDLPVTPDMLPKVRIVAGVDPVLQACNSVITSTKTRLAPVEWCAHCDPKAYSRQRVVSSAAPKEGVVHPYDVWRARLLLARVTLFEDIRRRRKADLDNPMVAADPLKLHVRAYITDEDVRTLDWLADKANYYRTGKRGRNYTGLPHIGLPRSDAPAEAGNTAGPTRGDVLMTKAWAPYINAIKAGVRSSAAMVRRRALHSPARARVFTTTLDDGSELEFVMDDYHLKRIEAAKHARAQIDKAIVGHVHPAAWKCPWTGEVHSLRDWSRLVPPLLRRDMFNMWRVLPADKQQKLRPFRVKLKQTKFQRAHNLDENNVPISPMLARE